MCHISDNMIKISLFQTIRHPEAAVGPWRKIYKKPCLGKHDSLEVTLDLGIQNCMTILKKEGSNYPQQVWANLFVNWEFGQLQKGKGCHERTQGLLEVVLGKAYTPDSNREMVYGQDCWAAVRNNIKLRWF